MFPVTIIPPRYIESWIVDIVDDITSIYEKSHIVVRQLSTAMCFVLMLLVNNLR